MAHKPTLMAYKTVSQYVDVCSVKESNLIQFFSYIFIMANIGLIIGLLMLLWIFVVVNISDEDVKSYSVLVCL